jgi:ankyrin repeat protein
MPVDIARKKCNREALQILELGPLQEQSEFSRQLLASFRKGDNETVLKMLKSPEADIYATNENGTTLLHYAAMFGKHETLSLLINKGANPNIGNNRNTTPIHKAAQRGELKSLQVLIQGGANMNIQVFINHSCFFLTFFFG